MLHEQCPREDGGGEGGEAGMGIHYVLIWLRFFECRNVAHEPKREKTTAHSPDFFVNGFPRIIKYQETHFYP